MARKSRKKRGKPECFEAAASPKRAVDTRERLIAKLDPRRFRGMSGKMAAIVRYILDAPPMTDPWIAGISITSDGFVILRPASDGGMLHDEFLGGAPEFDDNVVRLLQTAGLLADELDLFLEMYAARVLRYDESSIESQIASILGVGLPPTVGDAKTRATIAKLRNMTVERNCTPAEAAAHQAEADRLEKKLKGRRKP